MTVPIESKVTASAAAALVVSLAVAVLNAVVADSSLLGPLPAWLQGAIVVGAPPLLTFAAGWQAKHTPRSPAADA